MTNANYSPADRRPIRSRNHAPWRWAAQKLAAAGVSANAISVAGMLVGIGAGAVLAATGTCPQLQAGWPQRAALLAAACLIPLRLLANMLDGMVAVARNQASRLGELYNEIPDRISDTAILIGAGYAAGGTPWLGFAAALAAIFTAYVRAVGKAMNAQNLFIGPMAKQQRMFLVTLTVLAMALLPIAWQTEWHGMGWMSFILAIITVGAIFTALRRLARVARQVREGQP